MKKMIRVRKCKKTIMMMSEKMACVCGDQYNNQQIPKKTQIFPKVLSLSSESINISESLSVIFYVNNINCVMSVVDKHSSDDFEVLEFE